MVLPIAAITKFNDKHSVIKRHSNANLHKKQHKRKTRQVITAKTTLTLSTEFLSTGIRGLDKEREIFLSASSLLFSNTALVLPVFRNPVRHDGTSGCLSSSFFESVTVGVIAIVGICTNMQQNKR